MTELRLPIFTNLGWIFAVFVGALLVFHLMFVWPKNLTKRCWKVIDYVWLGTALLGVIGSVGVARQAVAQGLLTTALTVVESSAREVETALHFGTSGAVCRRFVRSEFSPPPRRVRSNPARFRCPMRMVQAGGRETQLFSFPEAEAREPRGSGWTSSEGW